MGRKTNSDNLEHAAPRRRIRDELAGSLPDGMPLEFLSADVTPRDRLAAIGRIKKNRPCLVVSTQCIEAGVDIDMDRVIRDFAPLDSIIQVAGRCNRNGFKDRCTVEIVSLVPDESSRAYAGMIYDKIILAVTHQILGNLETIDEEGVFALTKDFFARLSQEKDTGERETRLWCRWEEMTAVRKLLRGARRPNSPSSSSRTIRLCKANSPRFGIYRIVGTDAGPCKSWHAGSRRTRSTFIRLTS